MARKQTVYLADGTGVKATIAESMGFNHDIGTYATVFRWEGREFVAVKRAGQWQEWTARDRLSGGRRSRLVGI